MNNTGGNESKNFDIILGDTKPERELEKLEQNKVPLSDY